MTLALDMMRRTPKLLIADDDPGILRFLATRCEKMGFSVQTAANGLHAIVKARQHRPDLLIIDINMPGADGLSVSTHLLNPDKAPLDVIVITASSYADTGERCAGLGATHIRKGPDLWSAIRSRLIELFPEIAAAAAAIPTANVDWRHPRVLIVDNHREARTYLEDELGKLGLKVLFADDAIVACQMAAREEPSVILSEYETPQGGAQFLLWRLRSSARTAHVPVIMMTGKPLDELTQSALKGDVCGHRGVEGFLLKQADTGELFAAIQRFCAFTPNGEAVPTS